MQPTNIAIQHTYETILAMSDDDNAILKENN